MIDGRVGYACAPPGAYADLSVMKTDFLMHASDFLSDETFAASRLKGTTACYLLHDVYQVKAGDVVLTHAAAGGVGILLVQWGKALGPTVIGTYEIGKLASKSVTLSRPNYGHYTATRDNVFHHANHFLSVVKNGVVIVDPPRIFVLSDAAAAHQAIEARSGIGPIILRT